MLVQYGCGTTAPDSWRNFDISPSIIPQRIPVIGRFLRLPGAPVWPPNVERGDILKGLPIPDGSAEAIYCAHVLEHLAYEDFRAALRNTHRALAPDGIFRLVVPDLEQIAQRYLATGDVMAFFADSRLGQRMRPRGLVGTVRALFGNSDHRWMWDYNGLARELTDAGFRGIRRATFGDSALRAFDDVEERIRWEGPEGCVGVECRK